MFLTSLSYICIFKSKLMIRYHLYLIRHDSEHDKIAAYIHSKSFRFIIYCVGYGSLVMSIIVSFGLLKNAELI